MCRKGRGETRVRLGVELPARLLRPIYRVAESLRGLVGELARPEGFQADLAFVQRELFESAVTMGRAALKVVGLPGSEIDRVEREYRNRDCERLERQSETGDLHAASERMFTVTQALPDER